MELISGLLGLGAVGVVLGIVAWLVVTVITGYLLGLGIWSAMPGEIKQFMHYIRIRNSEEAAMREARSRLNINA